MNQKVKIKIILTVSIKYNKLTQAFLVSIQANFKPNIVENEKNEPINKT